MKLFPNLDKPKVEKKPEVESSTEEVLFSIESKNNPNLDIETDAHGNLVALESLKDEDLEGEHDTGVAVEELLIGEEADEQAGLRMPMMAPKMPRTVFIKSDELANVYLHGNCSESLDMLIHVLAHAPKEMECNISYCGAWFSIYDMMELIGAITASDATVNVALTYCRSPLELLLAKAADNVTVTAGYVVQPIRSSQGGSIKNVEETTRAERAYLDIVYESLVEYGILTKEEIDSLSDDNGILFIKGSDIEARLKS